MSSLIILTDEQIDQLDAQGKAEYQAYLEHEVDAWKLTDRQQIAEDLTRECFIVGYGGAAGGGKTDWGLFHIFHYCKRYPHSRVLILRTVKPELKRTIIPRSREKFDDTVAHYRVADMEWEFTNGSVIEFGYLNTDDDVYQYKGAEYDIVWIDEATETTEFAWRYLMSRIRIPNWRRRFGGWPHMILCTNPGGPGHEWFKVNLVEATNHGEHVSVIEFKDPLTGDIIRDPTTGEPETRTVGFVPAFVWDNPHMPSEYRLNLLMLDDVEMRQLLYGDWDVFAGQFFTDWRREIHVVRPFLIPAEWPRIRALDYGYRNPYCCLWGAVDWDSNVYVYRETYEKGLTALEQAKQVVELSKMPGPRGRGQVAERFQWSNADPAVFAKQGSGKSVAQQWGEGGLIVRAAKNDRIGGWSLVRQLMRPLPDIEYDMAEDMFAQRAKLRVFSTCSNLTRTIPNQIHDDVHVEDLHKNDDDHAVDTLRYLAQGLVREPVRLPPSPQSDPDGWIWERMTRSAKPPAHPVLGKIG